MLLFWTRKGDDISDVLIGVGFNGLLLLDAICLVAIRRSNSAASFSSTYILLQMTHSYILINIDVTIMKHLLINLLFEDLFLQEGEVLLMECHNNAHLDIHLLA